MSNIAAPFMAGVLQVLYENGELDEVTKEKINDMLRSDGLENVTIENRNS
jgi:hypothetical protein